MEILKRKNPSAHRGNALQISEVADMCCGDKAATVVCQYTLSVDTGTVAAADTISLGGSQFAFPSVSLTADNGAELLQEAINAAVYSAGYTGDDIAVSKDGTTVTITTSLSQLEFDYLQAEANSFTATTCQAFGDVKSKDKGETKVFAYVEGDDVVVILGALLGISNVNVTGTSVTTFDGAPTEGKVTTATALADGATSELTIVVTYDDAATATFTRSVTK